MLNGGGGLGHLAYWIYIGGNRKPDIIKAVCRLLRQIIALIFSPLFSSLLSGHCIRFIVPPCHQQKRMSLISVGMARAPSPFTSTWSCKKMDISLCARWEHGNGPGPLCMVYNECPPRETFPDTPCVYVNLAQFPGPSAGRW